MAKAKKPTTQHRRQPVKLAHGKTYADVLAERRSAERLQAFFVDSANQAVKALSAVAQQLDDAAAKLNELRNIEGEKQQADPGR